MSTASVTLPAPTIEALARGMHADPFAVLGPHHLKQNGLSGLAIRAFRPHAASMSVVDRNGGRTLPMARLHPEGVFEAFVESATRDWFDYHLRITWSDGNEI